MKRIVPLYIYIIIVVFKFIVLSIFDSYNFVKILWPEKKEKKRKKYLYGYQQLNLGNDATHTGSSDSALRTPI